MAMAFKKPIQRSLLIGCSVFIVFLCVVLSAQSSVIFSSALFLRYNTRLENILDFVEDNVDAEDLSLCINSGIPSWKYAQLQKLLNRMIDNFQLNYLYIVIPLDTGTDIGTMVNVVTATSAAERAAGEEDDPLLKRWDAYPREEILRYVKAWDAPGISFFEETSSFGSFYTACKPIRLPNGQTIALACADIPIDDLHRNVRSYVLINVALTVSIGSLFGWLLLLWLRRNVTGPVMALERSTRCFAERSHDTRDLSALSYDAPEIHTLNEVESLANAINRMSLDIRSYVEDILSAEGKIRIAQKEVEGITQIAFHDALTKVMNKAAYNGRMLELTEQIARSSTETEFAILMVDLNCLKRVNDTYGHEKGDNYILASCRLISGTFKHSLVYRIGGDEFVVILQGEDYQKRDALYRDLEARFRETEEDTSRRPWERCSAALGMAVYSKAGESAEHVMKRADETMYYHKVQMKMQRGNLSRRV